MVYVVPIKRTTELLMLWEGTDWTNPHNELPYCESAIIRKADRGAGKLKPLLTLNSGSTVPFSVTPTQRHKKAMKFSAP